MNDLLQNINKIHTTTMGVSRIKKNLDLEVNDVVEWCKKKIKKSDNIIRSGKNWYVNMSLQLMLIVTQLLQPIK